MKSVMSDKKNKVVRKTYGKEKLLEAVQDVQQNKVSVSEAARKHCIPRQTLSDHIKGKVVDFPKPGIQGMLTLDEEVAVVDYVQYMARRNMPLRRSDIRATIVDLIRRSGPERVLRCKFNLAKGPSDGWFQKFEKRHNQLRWAVPETLDRGRDAQSNEYVIDHFFNTYEQLINELGIADKPRQLYNCDESGINCHVTTRQKAYGVKGEKLYQRKMANHDHITVMMAVCAAGTVLPTFVVYNSTLPTLSIKDDLPKSWMFGVSPKGYMDKELFMKWFRDLFVPKCGDARPVLLVLDNHDSHISFDVLQIAKANQIELLGLPSHTTHILQPLDVGIFGALKRKYNELCVTAGLQSAKATINKSCFPVAWQSCITQAATVKVVQSAFRRTGLYPFDPCSIDQTKIKHVEVTSGTPEIPTVVATTSANKIAAINAAIGAIPPESEGVRHPITSVRKLPPELEAAFPIPVEGMTAPKKRRISVPMERVFTSEVMMKEVKDKEERIAGEEKARQERKVKRERKKALKESMSKAISESDNSDGGVEVKSNVDTNNCYKCGQAFPPCKGKGKRRAAKRNIDWVSCDLCEMWFHCFCVNLKVNELGDTYYCTECLDNTVS